MKKLITLASAGLLLFSLQAARAQKEVEPPAVSPMLEGQKPLAQPETREPAAPKQTEPGVKVKPKAKTKAKTKAKVCKTPQQKATAKKAIAKKPAKVAKTKGQKNLKQKPPEAVPQQQAGPDES
jgi:hypothetical protein